MLPYHLPMTKYMEAGRAVSRSSIAHGLKIFKALLVH